LAVLALSLAAFAQTPAQAMIYFGLVGKWSIDCYGPDSTTFTPTGDVVQAEVIFGDGAHHSTLVYSSAERVDNARLRPNIRTYGSEGQNFLTVVILKRGDGRIQTVSSVSSDGTVLIKDGVLVRSGAEIPSQGKCW